MLQRPRLGSKKAARSEAPNAVPAMQVVVTLGISALTPFVNPPRLNLGYTLGAGGGAVVSESLALPAVSCCCAVFMPALKPDP